MRKLLVPAAAFHFFVGSTNVFALPIDISDVNISPSSQSVVVGESIDWTVSFLVKLTDEAPTAANMPFVHFIIGSLHTSAPDSSVIGDFTGNCGPLTLHWYCEDSFQTVAANVGDHFVYSWDGYVDVYYQASITSPIEYYQLVPSADIFASFEIAALPITTPIPEPETYAMLLAGLGLLGCYARRREQKESALA